MSDEVLAGQRSYYAARAPEYDDWWFRRGRYDLGEEFNAGWHADVAEVEAAVEVFRPAGEVLELAAGTGLWTRHLARVASRVVAVDASSEMLEENRARVEGAVEYVVADLFSWEPPAQFDVCFFGFWVSHVPEARFDDFWALVRGALRRDGRVFLVDSYAGDTVHTGVPDGGELEQRRVSDGREFTIVKRRWEPEALAARVAPLGFRLALAKSSHGHFLYGDGR
jgi:SAM-dependent methyltransferase